VTLGVDLGRHLPRRNVRFRYAQSLRGLQTAVGRFARGTRTGHPDAF